MLNTTGLGSTRRGVVLTDSKFSRTSMALTALLLALLLAPTLLAATTAEQIAAGRAALNRDEHQKAVDIFTKVVTQEPGNAEAHYLLGVAYGDLAQAANVFKQASLAKKTKAEFDKAVELDPKYVDPRLGLINFYLIAPGFMGGSEEKAIEQAAAIKRINALDGHRAYARIYTHQKKPDLARKEYVDAVRENPNSARAHTMLATFLMTDKNWTGALHEIEMALKLDPAYMPAYFRLGQHASRSESNYARGEEALRKYLAHLPAPGEPDLASAWYWLGQVQEKQGKKNEARQSYLNAQKVAPNDADVKAAVKRTS
jgi:tetratricopeptide (TPR) repeat protein